MCPVNAEKTPKIVLGSSSVWRAQLLERLGLSFECVSPKIDEQPHASESAPELAARLALAKMEKVAQMVADSQPSASQAASTLIIASDQVASRGADILGKPGDANANALMLAANSGNTLTFYTAVAILDSASGKTYRHTDITAVVFRKLSEQEINAYIKAEKPWHCAGGFKVEALGISLFERVSSDDPTGLIGLPLIFVAKVLRECGYPLLAD